MQLESGNVFDYNYTRYKYGYQENNSSIITKNKPFKKGLVFKS